MKRPRRILVVFLSAVVILGGCCGFLLYLPQHHRMQDNPAAVYRHYETELSQYANRLHAGDDIFLFRK
jgi:hypothetical protein